MADRIVVVESERGGPGYRIQWEINTDGDIDLGAYCGQSKKKPSDEIPSDPEAREFWAYERAGFQVIGDSPKGYCGHDRIGFWWETKSHATAAIAKIRALAKVTLSGVPWPDWAKQAVAAGWKPPKGWKP